MYDAGVLQLDAGYPVWRRTIGKFTWREVAGTSMTTVTVPDPFTGTPSASTARIDAWNGLAANRDNNRVYLANAGGHADWAGNEAYEIDLQDDLPHWRLLRGSTMAPDVQLAVNYYADGRPSSTHLYYALQFVRAKARIFKMCSGSVWGSGNESNNFVDAFSLANNDWDPAGTWPLTPNGGVETAVIGRPYAQHPDTDDIYTFFTGAFRKWSAVDGTWSQLGSKPSYANDDIVYSAPSAVDPTRKRVLYALNAYRPGQGLNVAINSTTVADVVFTGPAAATATNSAGLGFVPSEDAFFLKTGTGGTVIRINAATWEATEVVTTGVAPPNAANGVWTRWLYLPRLKGFAYLATGNSNFWFFATE